VNKYLIAGLILIVSCSVFNHSLNAQVNALEKNELIDSLVIKLAENYVFPDVAALMGKKIRQNQQQKKYQNITDGFELAQQLTADLHSVSRDKHINVHYSEQEIPSDLKPMELPAGEKEAYGEYLKHDNYGISKLDILKGNIGYIDFNYLCSPEFAGETYAAMMNYIAHTEALIIDLRNCRGSNSPDAIPFLLSYLFKEPVHLNDLVWRRGNETRQSWTYAYVPGKKYTAQPVYVLTSSSTFSGAEEMAYDLQNLGRAVLMGEITGGGANPGGEIYLTLHFSMFVPVGRAVNPITKTNWEGVGVKPDSIMDARLALYKAKLAAARYVQANTKDEGWKGFLQKTIYQFEKDIPEFKPVRFDLKGFQDAKSVFVTGSFNNWSPDKGVMLKENGGWTLTTTAEPGKINYKFIVDGKYITDPANPQTEVDGNYTNSVMTIKQ